MACMCEQLFFWAKFICREKIYISSFFCVQASTHILISTGQNCEWHNRWSCGPIIPSCNWAFTSQWQGSGASLLSTSPHKLVFFILLASGVVFGLAVWGHVHNYERTCAVYKSKCLAFPSNINGVDTYNNTDYKAPVHAVIGMAGFTLDSFSTAVSRPLTLPDLDLLLLWRVLWKPTMWKSSNCDVTNQLVPIEM